MTTFALNNRTRSSNVQRKSLLLAADRCDGPGHWRIHLAQQPHGSPL